MNTIIMKNPNHIIILYQKKINQTWGVMLELITDRAGEPAGRYEGGPDCHWAQWRPHGELEMISPAGTQPVLLLPPPPGWREDGKITRTRYRNCVNFIYLRHMAHWWLTASPVVCEICMKQHQRCCWSLDRNVAGTDRMVCISSQTVISAKVRPGSGDRPGH